ncbi:TetR/AcrR family transcriptional regulator [Acetonema longum]|uniref:TetR family transcriptional regulator n=1 Tax=Acetonema longum DSM 6540 TaxID=1009370 RepID=F7NIH9_9FIRM|nr:TetR/AcrR family transcriptional regulator [Acetonema longum]EGO64125.1 TetR family transcriptional regulator [Acetonema longum DSM 6540]
MARVTKDPQERTNELIDAAEELFLTNGYDKTSVSDIVKKIGVAQGTFYYYFQTKEEILDAIAVRYFTMIMRECDKIDRCQPAPQQLRLMFQALFRVSMHPGKQGNSRVFRYLFPEKHFHLLERIEQRGYEMLGSVFFEDH